MKVLSYVVYGDSNRYWDNIPYLLVANSLIYKNFSMVFYVDIQFKNDIRVKNLLGVANIFKHIYVFFIDCKNRGVSFFQMWRMKPLWGENIDFLFCRDVDYALSTLERKAVQYFLEQDMFIVNGMRTFDYHNGTFMAGLCGFNCKKVLKRIQNKMCSFDDYVKYGTSVKTSWQYGRHQNLLIKFLKEFNLDKDVLEFYTYSAREQSMAIPNATFYTDNSCKNIFIGDCSEEIQKYIDDLFISNTNWVPYPPFIGRGWTCPKNELCSLINMSNNAVSAAVKKIYNL